jgi:hypothetical protein
MTTIAWHYTIGERAPLILSGGSLMPMVGGERVATSPADHSLPVVWFSCHETWEPSARGSRVKLVNADTGQIIRQRLAVAQIAETRGGAYRFGVDATGLLPYHRLRRAIRLSARQAQEIEARARQLGACSAHWYGTLEPVPVANCQIQKFDPDLQTWRRVAGQETVAA